MSARTTTGTVPLREALARTLTLPPEAAHSMPAEYYTSMDLLEQEAIEVLRREWMCLGHVGSIFDRLWENEMGETGMKALG